MQGVIPSGTDDDVVAERFGLSTAAATKKLSHSCQTLLKKSAKKLTKADRKKRTKCLDQRAKLIKDSERGAAPAKPGAGGTSTPAPGGGTTTPAPSPGTTTPGTPTPTPSPAPKPTPTPAPPVTGDPGLPATCANASSAVTVTATGYSAALTVTSGCATAAGGQVTFTYRNADGTGIPHNLFVQAAQADGVTADPSAPNASVVGTYAGSSDDTTNSKTATITLAPGRYVLHCTLHSAMHVPFQVV